MLGAALLAGCGGPISLQGVTILRYGPQAGVPTALTRGTLLFLDGCVILENPDLVGAPVGQTILWPPGTELRLSIDGLGVGIGEVTAYDGDAVELGGGEQRDQELVERLVGPVGRCISDVYWMATSLEIVDG